MPKIDYEINCISDAKAILGESPVWSSMENAVYWVDIEGKALFRTDILTGETSKWNFEKTPSMVALRKRGGLVIAFEDGLYSFDPMTRTGQSEILVPIEADNPNNRSNDGKCDVAGRLWLGTMNKTDSSQASGSLYCIEPDYKIRKCTPNYQVPNGLAWSPDNKTMYHTDTRRNIVWSYKYDPETGLKSEQNEFFKFNREASGGVDGAAVDVEGAYWTVLYRGGLLIRVLPDGTRDQEIKLPVTQPTMPTFGGADMKTLYLTTSMKGLDSEQVESQPLAGKLINLQVNVPGIGVNSFAG